MPLYEYECTECGAVFERIKPMSAADTPDPCPDCQSLQTERLLSTFATASSAATGTTAGCGTASGTT